MDVRCEKCLTVYELDDAKIGDVGLTVKCQECGNLFKVRRRADTAELVARTQRDADAEPPQGAAHDTIEERVARPPSVPEETTAEVPVAPAKGEERGWLLRSSATGDVVPFRELTTLQQWIVERKVTRADEISRGGDSWKPLGGIAELASFFHVVEQAEAVANASMPGLAVQSGAKVDAGFGAESIADLPTAVVKPVRRAAGPSGPSPSRPPPSGEGGQQSTQRLDRKAEPLPPRFNDTLDHDHVPPRRKSGGSTGLFVFLGLLVVGGGVAYVVTRGLGRSGGGQESIAALLQSGRAAFLLDTDDGFRNAISTLDRAVALDPTSIQARVELGEAHITWAAYLLEDSRRLEQGAGSAGAQAAHTMRSEAQAHLERARRVLEEPAAAEAQTSPALARAFGELLRVEGAPAAAVERYLSRAGQRGREDPELAYALAELALREGKTEVARERLADAIRTSGDPGAVGLARANYRIAALALASGRKAEAMDACAALFKISPAHERGQALCMLDPAPVAVAPADAGPLPPSELAPPVAPEKPTAAALAPPLPSDYKSLVREADHLSENGKSAQARKLYERALELDPRGIAALTGLGYCDLDAERFMQSVDRFNAALAVDATAGDAMLGLAESYKVRGQTPRAIDFYKKYLAAHPGGPKAQMAQKNIRDLEPRAPKESEGPDPSQEKVNEKVQIKTSTEKPDPAPRPSAEEPPP